MATFGIPDGAETYRVGPNNYVVYDISELVGGDEPLYMAWQVFGHDEWERITQQTSFTEGVDHTISPEAWKRMGVVNAGVSQELRADMPEHPWRRFANNLERESRLRPWLRDPEFLELAVEAYLEGRPVGEDEMKRTDWWRNASQSQRDWMELVNTDPATAEQQLGNIQRDIRNTFQQRGWKGDPNAIARYYAEQFIRGELTESELQDRIIHETDPYARGASPFAGYYAAEGDMVVEYAGQRYLKDSEGNYWTIGGPGQTARLGNPELSFDQELDVSPSGSVLEYFQQQGQPEHTQLGNVEFVREQFIRWLGPYADNFDEDAIGEWAHRIRQNEHARDQLTEYLRGQRLALFPEHDDPNLTWQDISEPWKQVYRQFAGHTPDDADAILRDLVKNNDWTVNQELLRNEGLNKGWEPVITEFMNDAVQVLGTSQRAAAQSHIRQPTL